MTMKLFDAHCHLQDPRIIGKAPQVISAAVASGVSAFAVNGVSEKDWNLVKEMGEKYPFVVPCFGLHPWYVAERSPNWFDTLKNFFETTPTAAVGEIGLDKGSKGREIDFSDQVGVFRRQLELAKELKKPASVHCVRAFGDILEIMKSVGPFPSGVILHSYLGSAEMVPEFAKLGAYFSFSGFLMSMSEKKAKKMLKAVPSDRLLLETDAPDALPRSELGSLYFVEGDPSLPEEVCSKEGNSVPSLESGSNDQSRASSDEIKLSKDTLNHPANIHTVLSYVAYLLEMKKEELAELSYNNAVQLFSYESSKLPSERSLKGKGKMVEHESVLQEIALPVASPRRKKPFHLSLLVSNDELLFETLTWVPADMLLDSMKLVCKKWYGIVRSPFFTAEHFRRCKTGLLIQNMEPPFLSHFVEIKENRVRKLDISFQFPGKILASLDGFVLFKHVAYKTLYMVNPITDQRVAIPRYTWRSEPSSFKCCLARDSSSWEYKVVASYGDVKKRRRWCWILTIGSDDSWREISIDHLSTRARQVLSFTPLFAGDLLFWVYSRVSCILVLNVHSEKFRELPVPVNCEYENSTHMVMGDSLAMVIPYHGQLKFKVWRLTDAEKGDWTMVYKIDLEAQRYMLERAFYRNDISLTPINFVDNGDLMIFKVYGEPEPYVVYSFSSKKASVLDIHYNVTKHFRRAHINSLISWTNAQQRKFCLLHHSNKTLP